METRAAFDEACAEDEREDPACNDDFRAGAAFGVGADIGPRPDDIRASKNDVRVGVDKVKVGTGAVAEPPSPLISYELEDQPTAKPGVVKGTCKWMKLKNRSDETLQNGFDVKVDHVMTNRKNVCFPVSLE